jgi:hypothetical protein
VANAFYEFFIILFKISSNEAAGPNGYPFANAMPLNILKINMNLKK